MVCARNGIEAVEQAQSDVKLVILDMIMPEMDGMAALRSIREKLPHVKIVVISGYTSPEKTHCSKPWIFSASSKSHLSS